MWLEPVAASARLPRMAKGFKEWQVVCDALAGGRQSIILRKGGIHEGREGFSFAEESFYLFPTRFHNQTQFVREGSIDPQPEWVPGEEVRITHHGEAVWAKTLTDWEQVASLQDLHIWTEETVRQRFDWEGKGMSAGSIHVALVRVRELAEPWAFDYEKKYGGCRSWVDLPDPSTEDPGRPVMDEETFEGLRARLDGLLV